MADQEWTSQKRLWAAYNLEVPDRVPIWMLFPREKTGAYVDVYNLPTYRRVMPHIVEKTDWLVFKGLGRPMFFSGATQIDSEVEETEKWTVTRQILHTPKGDLVAESRSRKDEASGARTKHFCEEPEDLEKVLSIPYEPVDPDVGPYHQAAKDLGEDGFMMVGTNVPVDILYKVVHPEKLALWTLTERDLILEFCQTMFERQYTFLKKGLDEGAGPIFHFVGTELIAPPLCSPATFDALVTPFSAPIFEMIHDYGCKVHVHHHGNIKGVIEIIADMGADGIHPIEEPPIGDCTLAEAKALVGDRVCLIGSVQWDDFARLEPEEMEALVKRQIRDAAPEGGHILSPSCGPYQSHLSERQQENLVRFIDAGRKWGDYPLSF